MCAFYFVPLKWIIFTRGHVTVRQSVYNHIRVFFTFNLLTTQLIREAAMAFLNMAILGGLRTLLIN